MACVGVPGGGGGVSGLDLCKRGEPLKWTDNGHFLRQLYGATFLTNEARCNFARPTRREPRKEGRDWDPDHFETPDKAHFETQRIRIISKHKSPG